MSDLEPTYYDLLGARPDASEADLKLAARRQMRATHPDTTGVDSHVQFDLVARAWEVLGDPERRAAYDALLRAREAAQAAPHLVDEHDQHEHENEHEQQHEQEDEEALEPEPEGATDPGRRATTVVVAAGLSATVAGIAAPAIAGADPQEVQLIGVYALTVLGVGAWTWRTGGWRPRAMLTALAVGAGIAVLFWAATLIPGAAFTRPVAVPIGLGLVVAGTGLTTWRLAARRRAKYDWTFD